MYTNFIDLNKCCPKGDFHLTRIDKIIDSTEGYEMMALLDYLLGYHQICCDTHRSDSPVRALQSAPLRHK
jgi:hypothetical protein